MSMDRADYENLSAAIHEADVPLEHKQTMALEIADGLCNSGPRFDPVRFLAQCEVGLTEADISAYSHRLKLRTKTGVGHARKTFAGSA